MKHGLTARVVDLDLDPTQVDPSPAAEPDRADPSWHNWLVEQVGRVRVQVVRAQRIEAKLRDLAAWRAGTLWEEDRRVEAEDRGARLAAEPSRVVARLRLTPQGCDWLIERWRLLARAGEANQGWTEEQVGLAFDLLGTPAGGRVGRPGSTVDPGTDAGRSLVGLARDSITELEAQRSVVAEADEIEQILAADDLRDTPTPELGRLRRYELALHKRLQWLLLELRGPGDAASPRPADPAPRPSITPTQNEPNTPADANETNPTATELAPGHPPGTPPTPPRPRPDLTRLARRDRRNRRREKRNSQSA